MGFHRIIMRLARNPGTEFAGGDDRRGYTLVAPLTADGHLDETAFVENRAACTFHHFMPDSDAQDGRLNRRGKAWYFDYADNAAEDDESIYRLGQHRFVLGEYVTVNDDVGRPLTYKVVEVSKVSLEGT